MIRFYQRTLFLPYSFLPSSLVRGRDAVFDRHSRRWSARAQRSTKPQRSSLLPSGSDALDGLRRIGMNNEENNRSFHLDDKDRHFSQNLSAQINIRPVGLQRGEPCKVINRTWWAQALSPNFTSEISVTTKRLSEKVIKKKNQKQFNNKKF